MRSARLVVLAVCLLFSVSVATAGETGGPFGEAIDIASQRVVKLYGGGIGREHGYASGVLVSADGQVVTALSVLLDSPSLRAVLPDGRRFPARVVKTDERRQLALLQIEAAGLPFFELSDSAHLRPGDWLIVAANPFKIADGPEPVSIAVGVFSGRTELSARRRAQEFPYHGPVLLTDVIVATPGSAGGAVVDVSGRLVGVVGKAVISRQTNTWINYALPVEEVAAFLSGADGAAESDASVVATESETTPDIGVLLFDVGGHTRPAYVERVRVGSPAHAVGLRPSDLILSLDGAAIASCGGFQAALRKTRTGVEVDLEIKRGDELLTLRIRMGEVE